ncbi:hypothetical protein [Methylomicrobium agile]|uniref:hypothetical protein n=1 Tax=Methylomicrobium agile TaxID=39774 RepID=UPI0004DF1167|nr:hypothetical protein [Methylomicrobium agile]
MSDLASYVESGELPPNDPEILAKLYQEVIAGESEESSITEQDEAGKTASAASGAGTQASTEAGESKTPEKEPDGILAKDGKHVISYDVLKSERQARQEAHQRLREMEAEIERLKNPGNAQPASLAFKTMTEEQIQELKDYFPEQYEAIASQQAAMMAVSQKLSLFEQDEQKRVAEEQQKVALTVQEEIDNNPILSHWQQNRPEIWAECVEMDNRLRANPATANLSMTERFAKVAAAMSQIYETPFKAEAEKQQSSNKTAPVVPTQQKPIINSLSDIPGGEAPEASERQRLEDSSSAEIGDRFMKMTEDQRNAYLNSLG